MTNKFIYSLGTFRKAVTSFALCWALLANGQAEPADRNLPTAPFVGHASDKSEWIVTYTYEDSSQSAPTNPAPVVKQLQIAKDGINRRETFTWSNNTTSVEWYVSNALIEQAAGWPKDFLVARLVGRTPNDDFKLGWINLTYFKKKEDVQGRSCWMYEAPDSVAQPGAETSKPPSGDANDPKIREDIRALMKAQEAERQSLSTKSTKVWIDVQTNLPVKIQVQGLEMGFEFTKTIPDMQLPADYQKQLDLLKKMYPNAVGDVR